MPKYKKCPRCEINYILEEESYCELCKKELKGEKNDEFETLEDAEDAELCPKCHKNYLDEGETICKQCAMLEEFSEGGALSNDIEAEEDVENEEQNIDARPSEDEEWVLALDEMQDEAFTEALEEDEEEDEEEEPEDASDKDFYYEDLGDIGFDDEDEDEDEDEEAALPSDDDEDR